VKAQRVAEVSEEADLVGRCRGGDRAAFGRLVVLYKDRVFNLCLRMCGNASDAEDYAQEAFIKAMRAIDRFDGQSRLYTWLFRIAVNTVLSGRRKGGGATIRSLDEDRPGGDFGQTSHRDRLAARESGPADEASLREEHAIVLSALAELDEDHRAAVILRDVESLDYAEIAEALGVAVGTVKSRLHRARMALRERLESMKESPGNG
jgi:RNA polymerase sigma-70 factor, ECF subfamily